MSLSLQIHRTACFSTLTPHCHSQTTTTVKNSSNKRVTLTAEMLRRVDNACLMRWSSYICSHYKYSFLQQLLPARNAVTSRSGSAHAKVELQKVTYTFKQADDARAEVAVGTKFPGRRLATTDPVVVDEVEEEDMPESNYCSEQQLHDVFQTDGFVEIPQLVSQETAQELVGALDAVLAGQFDTGPSMEL